ncbi:MAG: hypothetical protein OEV40_28015 [Acidimicrobiia bacterium]|nr:hypothetical protein [Acidimicrobiia bacterium]
MSAITYPATGHRGHAPAAPSTAGLRRRLIGWRPRRWDDHLCIERNASLSELAIRSVPVVPGIYR